MIRRLLLLNGLAIVGVALNHTIGWGYVAMFWWTDRYRPVAVPDFSQMGGLSYWGLRFFEQLLMFSIPAFLFVSGYFIAVATGRTRSNVSPPVVRQRIINLALPYLLWSLIYFGASAVLEGQIFTPWQYLRLLLVGGAAQAFYYVPLVIQLYLLSLLMVPLARQHWRTLLAVSLAIQLVPLALRYPVLLGVDWPWAIRLERWLPAWFFPGHLFWFAVGVVVGFHVGEFRGWLARWKWWLLGLMVITVPLGILEWEWILQASGRAWLGQERTFFDDLYSALAILAFLAFERVTPPAARQLSDWGTRSYGIYLAHSLVLLVAVKAIYHAAPWLLAHQILLQPLLLALGLAVPLALMALVNRSPARRFYAYLFG